MSISKTLYDCITENIKNQNICFVFPTDVACKKWADWIIKNTETQAVALERFIAWDNFKGECIKAEQENLETIPSLLRKLFAAKLLKENKEKPFLKFLVPEDYAKDSDAFTNSVSKLLPSLQMWTQLRQNQSLELTFDTDNEEALLKKFYEDYKTKGFSDEEDQDYEEIFQRYSAFLKENNLFDPAWITPDFSGSSKEYFIIYPEVLEDWEQYKYHLSKIPNIHFIHVPEDATAGKVCMYDNSRLEVQDVAKYLRQLHDQGVSWSEIALSVPNLDNYGAYLDRELELYEIPHSIKYSKSLNSYGAGNIFTHIQDCVSNDFSYESIKTLLLNEDIPWKQKFTIDNLLLFGKENNCLLDWDEAFAHPVIDKNQLYKDDSIRNYFKGLRTSITNLVNAKTFKEAIKAYTSFRETFIDSEGFATLTLSDKILSRCVEVLNELVDLEEKFGVFEIPSCFSFFTNHLNNVQYLPQGTTSAVQVYPYRTAAAAPYKIHIILDSTQDSLSVGNLFKPMGFMNENKKKLFIKIGSLIPDLAFNDSDPSYDFIKLYQNSSSQETCFTASNHAFSGTYGFLHSKIVDTLRTNLGTNYPNSVYQSYKTGFDNWKNTILTTSQTNQTPDKSNLKDLIYSKLQVNKKDLELNPSLHTAKITVSESAMNRFFTCPRLWLFKNILKIDPLNNEAELIDSFIEGNVNHKVMELYFTYLKNHNLPLAVFDEKDNHKLSEENKEILRKAIHLAIELKTPTPQDIKDFLSSPEDTCSAFYSFGKLVCSIKTIKIIQAMYSEDTKAKSKFKMLETAIARLNSLWRGYKVYAMEQNIYAFPPDAMGIPDSNASYVFNGRIDCILAAPNETEFTIIDFKTKTLPSKLYCTEDKPDKPEQVINFQMPMYLYLVQNNLNESQRITATNAMFYSIKEKDDKKASKLFVGRKSATDDIDIKHADDAKLAQTEFLQRANLYVQKISNLDFKVTLRNQDLKTCSNKGEYAKCGDFQPVCRRFFTVNGEND